MAHIYRLVALVLVFFSTPSFASFPAVMTITAERNAALQSGLAAGALFCSYGFTVYCRRITPCTESYMAGSICLYGGNDSIVDSAPAVSSCPISSTLAGGTCTCTPPSVDNAAGNSCDAPPPPVNTTNSCPKLGGAGGYYQGPGGTGDKTVCQADARVPSGDPASSGCQLVGYASMSTGGNAPGASVSASGFSWGAQMEYSGAKCVPGTGDGGKPAPDDPQCVPPKVAGVVNGKTVCYTPSAGSPDGGKPSSSVPPVTTVQTDHSDGSKSSTATGSKTDCADGKCTTTTTTTVIQTSPGGLIGAPQVNITTSTCTQGPGCSALAPNSKSSTTTSISSTSPTPGPTSVGPTVTSTTTSTIGTSGASEGKGGGGGGGVGKGNGEGDVSQFAGQCGAAPFCDGDAILCAVADATFSTNCALRDPKVATPLYDAALLKTGDQTVALAGNSTVSVNSTQFDQTELLGAAVGMTDRSITVMNSTINLPFSNVNVWLARLGIVLQAVTFLLCARVVVRG